MNMEERKSWLTSKQKKMRKSTVSVNNYSSFSDVVSSLPYDVALNCLARISRIHYPTLSLYSKTFRSLLASPDQLDATRSRIGKTETFTYVCLDLNENPSWFILAPIPEEQKLIPISSFPYQHSKYSTVLSIGSEIYIIGGYLKGENIKRVLILDCRSHHWRQLPDMRVARREAVAEVIDGKIQVIGGCPLNKSENWGEIYDPKTQTWEPISPTRFEYFTVQNRLVIGEIVYDQDMRYFERDTGLVEIETVLYRIFVFNGVLKWFNPKEEMRWSKVKGLEEFPDYDSVEISNNGTRRVKVWWTSVKDRCHGYHRGQTGKCKTEIWCAEVSLERPSGEEIWGSVEWFENVFTFDRCDPLRSDFFLHSAMVTH